jgi:hypothetical protein
LRYPATRRSLDLADDVQNLIAGETVAVGVNALVTVPVGVVLEAARTKETLAEGLGSIRAQLTDVNIAALWDAKLKTDNHQH